MKESGTGTDCCYIFRLFMVRLLFSAAWEAISHLLTVISFNYRDNAACLLLKAWPETASQKSDKVVIAFALTAHMDV